MAKQKRKTEQANSADGLFLLKAAMYVVLGSLWLKITDGSTITVPIPLGLIIGVVLASHEHFRTDRKIDYAILLVSALIGFMAPFGLYIAY